MNISRKLSLIICRSLWNWCAKHPDKKKCEWPGFKKYGEIVNSCPCCEYSFSFVDGGSCTHCPLLNYAWYDNNDGFVACERDSSSPYRKWMNSISIELKQKAALQIVRACNKALKDIKNKTKKKKKTK